MALSDEDKIKLVTRTFLIYKNCVPTLLADYSEPTEEQFRALADMCLIAAQSFNNATYAEDFFDPVEDDY